MVYTTHQVALGFVSRALEWIEQTTGALQMDAFEDDDPMDYFASQQEHHLHHQQQQQHHHQQLQHPQQQHQQQQHDLRSSSSKVEKEASNIMGNGELLDDDPIGVTSEIHEQGNSKTPSSSPNTNNNIPNTNNTSSKLMLADQADSKEGSKDAGSWSSHATAVLLDVFRDKRVAINGRNFRGEEWEELATGVNERCQSLTSTSPTNTTTAAITTATTTGPSRVEPWKNAKQCSYKMSNLKRKYKSEKELQQLSSGGAGMSSWQWFAKMDAIFGSDPKYSGGTSGFGCDDEFTIANLDNSNTTFKSSSVAAAGFVSDLPTSKSASTNNLDGCSPSPRPEAESSPRSEQLLGGGGGYKSKRQCVGVSSSPLAGGAAAAAAPAAASSEFLIPGSFGDSMKLVLAQQQEMLHLLRELVTSPKPPLQRHDQEILAEFGGRRDFLDFKLKIESADRELNYLKQLCETKEKELKDAVLAYEDKNRLKNELVGKLLDAVYEKELSKMRRLVSMDRNLDSMTIQQQQQQHHRHDHRL